MKLDYPLSNLIKSCETICVADCCGIDAYDFSPIHLASALITPSRVIEDGTLALVRRQIDEFRERIVAGPREGTPCETLNHIFHLDEVDEFLDELTKNLEIAIDLVAIAAEKRHKPEKNRHEQT